METNSILDNVLKNAHEKAIPHDAPIVEKPPEPVVKKPETAKPPISANADKTPDELAAARAKVAELEGKLSESAKTIEGLKAIEKARELWKGKKRIEAIEILAGEGGDLDAELNEFVKDYIAAPSKETKNAVEAKLDQLLEKDAKREEESKKAKEAEEAAQKTKEAEDKKSAAEKVRKENIAYTASVVAKFPDKFDLCSRDANKEEAGEKAPIIALACLKRDKINLDAMTADQAEKAMIEALTEIETEFEKKGQAEIASVTARFQKKTKPADPAPAVKVETAKTDEGTKSVAPPAIKVSDSKKPASVKDVIEQMKKRAIYQ